MSHDDAILEAKRRRLRVLEEQKAQFGNLCPPHIVTEIEDLQREIAVLSDKTTSSFLPQQPHAELEKFGMNSGKPGDYQDLLDVIHTVHELPKQVLVVYARLWQLETWLRRMVYIELRALLGDDWHTRLKTNGADRSRTADKRLSHMPTPEMDLLSYATFSEICRIIADEWSCFQAYLPPIDLWEAKLAEIKQIRNRVAHFRVGHKDDLQRTIQLLRDIDEGFWRFCTSYNDPHPVLPPSDDPIVQHFITFEQFPYAEIVPNEWAKVGIADPGATFNLTIDALRRPWQSRLQNNQIIGSPGYLYDVSIAARDGRVLDYRRYLQDTAGLHPHFVHICLSAVFSIVRITIPSILGRDPIIQLIEQLIRWIPNALRRPGGKLNLLDDDSEIIQKLADDWPEYVLGPKNPLRSYQKIGVAATIRTAFIVNRRSIRRIAAILIILSLDLVVRSYSLLNRRCWLSHANVRSTIHRFG